ncbi:MAG: hypothetical protein A3D94_23125 [Alphaproteobacteria bacterium RIFCSPHIGHO2_12_FULL_66_14]|jgi:hypothetical protein|nr:MAG: hypothetical protein A3D94_23125 [Alphaproteobacteria bacterium RIFCSPHIGHO2_12_FULL_66_14]
MRDLNKLRSGLSGRGILAACVASVAVLAFAGGAEAGDGWKKKGRGYYAPGYYGPAYVKVPPGHVRYYAPAPVYYVPRPVVVYPEPMMYAPAYPAYGYPGGNLSIGVNVPLR